MGEGLVSRETEGRGRREVTRQRAGQGRGPPTPPRVPSDAGTSPSPWLWEARLGGVVSDHVATRGAHRGLDFPSPAPPAYP